MNLSGLLAAAVAKAPGKIAVSCGDEELTYAQFKSRCVDAGDTRTLSRANYDVHTARDAVQLVKDKLASGRYDVMVLDEVNYAVKLNLITVDDVLGMIVLVVVLAVAGGGESTDVLEIVFVVGEALLFVALSLYLGPRVVGRITGARPLMAGKWAYDRRKDLLKPEYKGKIASHDPRQPGPAWSTVGYLNRLFGPDYLRELYKDQEVVLTSDARQLAEWVARGTYPIGLGLYMASIEPMKAAGLPLERVYPEDGPGILTGGFGTVMRIKDGPHPNAAAAFINWWASREAQEMYEQAVQEMSLRVDITHQVPGYIVPKPGVDYPYNAYDPDQHYNSTLPAVGKLQEALGR